MPKTPTNPTPPEHWTPEVAYAAANAAQEVAGRLDAVLVLLEHVEAAPRGHDDGWTVASIIELVEKCQVSLLEAVGGAK